MTFLELVKRLRQEAGVTGSGPSTVASQTGELKRLVDWTASAWREIQNLHDTWRWMRSTATVSTTAGDGSYTLSDFGISASFAYWYPDSFTIYRSSIGQSDERDLTWTDYDTWRRLYNFGSAASTRTSPNEFSIAPDESIVLGFLPDDVYVVKGDYQSGTITLADDADIPACPTRFHEVIVWKALMYYGEFESAPEAYGRARKNYSVWLDSLERSQLPPLTLAPPLV